MNPAPYRSTYMRKREYGAIGNGRLGNHLPRIASGDGEDDAGTSSKSKEVRSSDATPQTPTRNTPRTALRDTKPPLSPMPETPPQQSFIHGEYIIPEIANADVVAGRPDRIRLSRQDLPSPAKSSPLPSSRLTRGLWADTQRHLLHAYEYLCHVGEAQQWMEGCLETILKFGVVEMEEGLRNGEALAELAIAFIRVWEGNEVADKIKIFKVRTPSNTAGGRQRINFIQF